MKPTVIDLFCGAGGFSDGFRQAGFDIILGIDKEPKMLATYRANHSGTEVWKRDVLTIDPSELPDADIIIGSPPCQDFSMASSKKNPKKGMILVNWMLDAVRAKRSKFWVMENVPPVAKYLPKWIPVVRILNAVEYGVPQTRKRCFVGDYPVPKPTHNNGPNSQPTLDGSTLKPWVTVRNAIGNLQSPAIIRMVKQVDRVNEHRKKIGLRSAPDPIDEPSRTILATEGKSTEKGMILVDGASECRHRKSSHPFRRYNADKPLTAALHTEGHRYYFMSRGSGYRRLTVREAARLQSFPDSFVFVGSTIWQYRQIGEAVPPLIAQRIAEEMRSSLGG